MHFEMENCYFAPWYRKLSFVASKGTPWSYYTSTVGLFGEYVFLLSECTLKQEVVILHPAIGK